MSQEQKDRLTTTISILTLIVSIVWFVVEPKFETLLLVLSTIATASTLYAGKKRAERIEARYKIDPEKVFQTSVALWGPPYTGKTWFVHAFGRTLYTKYNKPVNKLIYDFKTITGYKFLIPPDGRPTSQSTTYEYVFERLRTSFDDASQSISSFKHRITVFDDKGASTVDYHSQKSITLINIADSDVVILALDPTQVLVDSFNFPKFSKKDYAEMVRELFSTLEELRPDKKHYYAVCVMKADQIAKAASNKPEGLIRLYFGQEMINALQIPEKERIKVFVISSFGFIANQDSINLQPNSKDDDWNQLADEENWEPYNVEFPLFWAFEKIELLALRKNIPKTWWKKLTANGHLKKYIRYPEEVFN